MFGIIGVGAAGGNIADEAITRGIKSIAINYSQSDIESLENVEERLVLVGSEGVGRDRGTATSLMKDNWEMALDFIKQHMSTPSIDVVLVCFATSGGSGSGISPMLLEVLQYEMPNKTFVACPILPDKSEVLINQINCMETMTELSKLNLCVLPIDNEKIRTKHGHLPKNKIYQLTNTSFIDLLVNLKNYTLMNSKNGIVDRKDMLQLFSTQGVALIAEASIDDISNFNLSEGRFAESIQQSWKNSIFSPIEFTQVLRGGVIFDGQESLMDYLKLNEVFSVFEKGMPVDLFEGYFHEESCKVTTILTGLSWVNSRIHEVEQLINHQKMNVSLEKEKTFQPKVNYRDFTTKIRKQPSEKKSITDILSKYQR